MFMDKLIKNKHKHYRILKSKKVSAPGRKIQIISERIILSEKQQKDIFQIVESDLKNDDFNYNGRTLLEIQLLLNISNGDKIELRRTETGALVIIR